MGLLLQALSAILQLYAWGFFVSLAFFLLVMFMRGVGTDGYAVHVMACLALALAWPWSVTEIVIRVAHGV